MLPQGAARMPPGDCSFLQLASPSPNRTAGFQSFNSSKADPEEQYAAMRGLNWGCREADEKGSKYMETGGCLLGLPCFVLGYLDRLVALPGALNFCEGILPNYNAYCEACLVPRFLTRHIEVPSKLGGTLHDQGSHSNHET